MESVIATREEVERFLSIQNCGCRYGFGFGAGSGHGSHHGDGYGEGSGYDSGSGHGRVYGSSDGSGLIHGDGSGLIHGDGSGLIHGDGYGYGICHGSGCGNGSGYCGSYDDIKALNGNIVDRIDCVPTIITQVRGNIARGYIVKEDLTLDPCFIAKVGDSFAHGKTLKEALADAEAKEMKNTPIEKRIEKFIEVFGSLDSEHTGKKFYDWHHILTGSCKMGRDGFCKSHDIDLEKKYTVRYFLDITENAYGGDVIKQIRESYGLMVNGDMPGYVLNIPSLDGEEGMA